MFGLFEANVSSDDEAKRQQREAADKLAAATYDVRERFGRFLFGARDLQEYQDRLALTKNDIIKTIEPHVFPRTGVVRRVLKPIEAEFKSIRRQAAPGDDDEYGGGLLNPEQNMALTQMGYGLKGSPGTTYNQTLSGTPVAAGDAGGGSAGGAGGAVGGDGMWKANPGSDSVKFGPTSGPSAPAAATPTSYKSDGGAGGASNSGGGTQGWQANGNTDPIGPGEYTIQSGDTLSDIAGRAGIADYNTIADANDNITNPDMIYAGDTINIPGTTPSSATADSAPVSSVGQTSTVPDPGTGQGVLKQQSRQLRRADFEGDLDTDITYTPSDAELEPEGDFAGYLDSVDQGAEGKVNRNFVSAKHRLDEVEAEEGPWGYSNPDTVNPYRGSRGTSWTQEDHPSSRRDPALLPTRESDDPYWVRPVNQKKNRDEHYRAKHRAEAAINRFASWCQANRVAPTLTALDRYNPGDRAYLVIASALQRRTSSRRTAAPDYLQKADEALTNLLNQKAQEFQEGIAPLQQALMTVQQAEQEAQAANPMSVLPPAGTVNVLPGQDQAGGGEMDPNALAAMLGGGGGDPMAGGGGDIDPAMLAQMMGGGGGMPPEAGQQMMARRRRRHAMPNLKEIRIHDRDNNLFSGVDGSGKRVVFKTSPEESRQLRDVMFGDLAQNFSGVSVDDEDIVREGRRRQAGDSVKVKDIPECDIHKYEEGKSGVPAAYDGKTKFGPWANMCEDHFKSHGVGLGTGRGQKLEKRSGKDSAGTRTARSAEELWSKWVSSPSTTLRGDDSDYETFAKQFGVGQRALNRLRQNHGGPAKTSSRKEAWMGWGPQQTGMRRVAGFDFDHHLNGYITTASVGTFPCECGESFPVPSGYRRCGSCDKAWNSYVIGTDGPGREASLEKVIVREIPVRKDVIVANKRQGGEYRKRKPVTNLEGPAKQEAFGRYLDNLQNKLLRKGKDPDEIAAMLENVQTPQDLLQYKNLLVTAADYREACKCTEGKEDDDDEDVKIEHFSNRKRAEIFKVTDEGGTASGEGEDDGTPRGKKSVPRDWAKRDQNQRWTR